MFYKMYWQIKISEYNRSSQIYIVYPYLMSVASKTKTKRYTTVVLGLLVALSALPTWANTSPWIETPTVYQPVVSTQANQDLSVLRTKLKERFSWISEEVVSLVKWTTTPAESFHGSADTRVIDMSQWIVGMPAKFGQDFFVDIENDPYRSYINRLSAYGVLSPSQKFYPQNYVRVNDFAGLLAKLYQKKYNKTLQLDSLVWLESSDGIMTKWMFQQSIRSLGLGFDVQLDGNLYDKLIRSEAAYYLVRLFDLPGLSIDEVSSVTLPNYFADTFDHPFSYAIHTLASLDIISSQTSKFYPDNYLRHYDFVTIFVNSLLVGNDIDLPATSFSTFADVSSTISYFPQLVYAADRGMIDELITSRRGQLFFEPNSFMTKSQVYQILTRATGVEIVYNEQAATQEKMTRAELAQLIVDSFGFEPKTIESENLSSDGLDDETLISKLRVLLSML